ncbi:hypothetical protein BH11ACT5_BH11ACT5_15050 [soil metagenome]
MTHTTPTRVTRSRSTFWIAFAMLFSLSSLWALASPIFSIPDENAHSAKAVALAHGQLFGYERADSRFIVVDLPPGYEYSPGIVCFAYAPDRDASCGIELGDPKGTDYFGTWVGAYNPTYYAIVSWPSLIFEGSAGIYAMRIVSAAVGSLILALGFVAGFGASRARWMPAGLAFAASPMVIYFLGSVNPQGFEVACAVTLWIGLLRLLQLYRGDGDVLVSKRVLWAIVVVGASGLAVTRATGPLWLVIVLGACLIAAGWQATKALFTDRGAYVGIGIIAAVGVFSLVWTLTAGGVGGQASEADAPLVNGTFLQAAWYMLQGTPVYLEQAIGTFGWLDAVMPSTVHAGFFVSLALITVIALATAHRRGLLVMLLVLALALLVPIVVQSASVARTGIIWQGRYGLFLYLGIPIVAAWLLGLRQSAKAAFLSFRVTVVSVSTLVVVGIACYVLVLARYVVGADKPIGDVIKDPQWQPPLGAVPLIAIFVVVSAAWAAWLILRARRLSRAELSIAGD